MKQFFLGCLMLALTAGTAACSDDNYYVVEPGNDLKAQNIAAVGNLFTAMARQPEMADQLIATAKTTLFDSYTALLPISDRCVDQRGIARGKAVSALIDAALRQPDMETALLAAADRFLGPYDARFISDALNAYAITTVSAGLSDSIARAPESLVLMQTICKRYLGFEFEILAKD